MTADPSNFLALAALLAGAAAGLLGPETWMRSGGWVLAVAGGYYCARLTAAGEAVMAAAVFGALGVVAGLLLVSDWRVTRRPVSAATDGDEPGPPDCRDPDPGEVPDGPAWRDHLTHTPGQDEDSPRLRARGPRDEDETE